MSSDFSQLLNQPSYQSLSSALDTNGSTPFIYQKNRIKIISRLRTHFMNQSVCGGLTDFNGHEFHANQFELNAGKADLPEVMVD